MAAFLRCEDQLIIGTESPNGLFVEKSFQKGRALEFNDTILSRM